MTEPKRTGGTNRLPEEVQENMRKRLRMVREHLGIMKSEIRSMSPSTITGYEYHDISTFKLGDMHALAREFGWTLSEFFLYIVGNEEVLADGTNPTQRRMGVYLRSLPENQQDLACELLRTLVDFNAENGAVQQQDAVEGTRRAKVKVIEDGEEG